VSGSALQIAPGLLTQVAPAADPGGGLLLLTDSNVEAILPPAWRAVPRHVLPAGERSKSWAELERCLVALDGASVDRDGLLLAVGGGVVTDLGGLAASLHRRGIPWQAVPTSLIGQVDAALGGKTAVNLGGGKNTVGTVHLPERVLIDPSTLATLPHRHLLSGMAEVLKTALIAGPGETAAVLALEPQDFAGASAAGVARIEACVATKLALVKEDLHDRGPRRKLNLGHTFGHALEALSLGAITHGEAVGLGLLCAARYSGASELEQALRQGLSRWGLPIRAPGEPEAGALTQALQRDKKRRGSALTIIEVAAPGAVSVAEQAPEQAVMAAFSAVTQLARA